MKNKTNIALAIFVIIAILEFMLLQGVIGKYPELRGVIWQEVKDLGFAIIIVSLGITIMITMMGLPIIAVYYVSRCIKTWRWHRKYRKTQKQILDDPVHWPGHRKATEEKKN